VPLNQVQAVAIFIRATLHRDRLWKANGCLFGSSTPSSSGDRACSQIPSTPNAVDDNVRANAEPP